MIKNIYLKKSKIDKTGVFASRDFKKGDTVLKWNPKIINESEIKKLSKGEAKYILTEANNAVLLMQPPERYINHSCDSNTLPKNHSDVATKDIRIGEEITTNYDRGVVVSFKCNCGSNQCKGIIK